MSVKEIWKKFKVCIPIILMGCVEPFNPPEIEQAESYLVVDGYINAEQGSASIVLSRTRNLSDPNQILPQPGAEVSIQIDGQTYMLLENVPGIYEGAGIFMTPDEQAKLIVKSSGKSYESDLVSHKVTPEIDSVTYQANGNGVQFEVTTHDPANSTWFYQWQYEETARYRSKFYSNYYVRGENDYAQRTLADNINNCWNTTLSTSILVATSKSLTSDVIYKFPIQFVPENSWKLQIRYSLLIRQYAIEEETYNYWLQLKKNTENLGSLFDPQPSQVTGNIRCVSDPSEPVLGYFSVRSIREKRIYVNGTDLPKYSYTDNRYGICSAFEIDSLLFSEIDVIPTSTLLIDAISTPAGAILGYTTQNSECIDCRIVSKGVTKKPEWWEE